MVAHALVGSMENVRRRVTRLLLAIGIVATLGSSFGQARERMDDAAAVVGGAYASPASLTRVPHRAPARCVVVVTLDGVRWQDIFDDPRRVPNLRWLMSAEGAALGAPGRGARISASGPSFVSLPGYLELMTGRSDSGCKNNDCASTLVPTVADEIVESGRGDVAVFSSWSGIDRAASAAAETVAVSAGRYGGRGRALLEQDFSVAAKLRAGEHAPSELDGDDFRPDAATGELALAYLAAHRTGFTFVGLGETDEYAHLHDVPGYVAALRRDDAIIGRIAELVLDRNAHGVPTTLIVTTDHGRAHDFADHGREHPESARIWLVAAGAGIEARGRVDSPAARHLADIVPTIRSLMQLPAAGATSSRDRAAGHVLTELLHGSR